MSTSTGPIPATPQSNDALPGVGDVLLQRAKSLGVLAWPLLALLLLLAFNLVFTEHFFHLEIKDGHLYGLPIDVINRGAPVLLLSLGMALVIATGGIDLSVGAVMAMSGAVAVCLVARPPESPLSAINIHGFLSIALIAGLAVGLLAGLWNGVLVAYFRLQPIIATLILMVAGRGVALLMTGGQQPTFQNPDFAWLGGGFIFGLPVPAVIAFLAFLIMLALVRGSALGLLIEAVGDNRTAARVAGVNARGVRLACYVVSGFLAGLAGLIAAADIKSSDPQVAGLNLELDAILAVAIGGTSLVGGRFSLIGAVIGAIVIQLLTTTILAQGYQPAFTRVLKAGVVIALCLLQSPRFRSLFRVRRSAA